MEEEFKEAYQSYLDWIQEVKESRTTNKFQQGGQIDQQQAAQQIEEQANQMLNNMPANIKSQIEQMEDEKLVQIGQQYIEQMAKNKDENAQTFAQYFQINPVGTSKLILALVYQAKSEQNPKSPKNQRVSRPAAGMNVPPSAFGRKGLKIMALNGHCPEGYEVVRYGLGGCVKCRKAKLKRLQDLLVEDMKCGGKKRIKKGSDGEVLLKKGGKSLTKNKAESLKYQGGPGDINSTEGMKPNKKQKKMLSRKVGGMVNNAKKITIYGQPGMIDFIKY